MTVEAVPNSIAGLRGGAVSLTFHVGFKLADEAFKVHKFQGKTVVLDIYVIEED